MTGGKSDTRGRSVRGTLLGNPPPAARLVAGLAIALAVLGSAQITSAQDYLLDPNIKVERHNKRTTRTEFPRNAKISPLDQWGLMFEQSVANSNIPEEANLIQFEALSRCEKPDVKLLDVHHHTPGTESDDVLYYSPDDAEQRAKAEKYSGFKVAYQPALMRNPQTGQPEYWQAFARFLQIECLPVRFRFTYVGSVRYMEFRSGDAAWEVTKSPK